MDGYLKIKTKIDNSGIDKDIQQLEDKIKKVQNDNLSLGQEQKDLEDELQSYQRLIDKAEKYRSTLNNLKKNKKDMLLNNPNLSVSTTPEFSKLNSDIDILKLKYNETASAIDKQSPKIDKVHNKLEKIRKKQSENNSKIAEFKEKIEKIKLDKVQKSMDNVGKNIQNQIGKLGKMAFAVIGIRSAWNAVRSAMNLAKQYNPQISADFEYIGYAIANLIIPFVQKLVSLLYTVLSYINSIVNAWFGINLFSNSSVKNFQKMQSSAKNTAKSAKEIQRSLQGFDEMNILQDNSKDESSSSNANLAPSVDLSGMQAEIPKWLEWIIDNKDILISILSGLAFGITAVKLGLDGIKSLGIGLIVGGIVQLIQDIIKFIKDPSFDNFLNILRDIAIVATGIGLVLGNWPLVIGAVITLIVVEIIKHWEQIKGILRYGWPMDI